MAISLSNVIFTDQDDIIPPSGVEPIYVPAYTTINTLAGDDIINGGNNISIDIDIPPDNSDGFRNILGTLNTNSGNDLITGTHQISYGGSGGYGLVNRGNFWGDETGFATINMGDGNDTITGISRKNDPNDPTYSFGSGLDNVVATIDTGDGNDIITGIGLSHGIYNAYAIYNEGIGGINTDDGNDTITGISQKEGIGIESRYAPINTGDGNDIITGTGDWGGIFLRGSDIDTGEGNDILTGTSDGGYGLFVDFLDYTALKSHIDTGEGDDIITGTGDESGIRNGGTINTGNGDDFIIANGKLFNSSEVFLGEGNDSITADTSFPNRALENLGFIGTGDGNDTITTTGVIYNEGIIETGNGDDSIIVDGGVDDLTGTRYGIYNNRGAINMGDGNDSIIANEGFQSGLNSGGAWFLGEGDDYIKGYGSGDFYGGNGNDTLELTPGTYTVGIWGEGGESPIFTKGNQLMITSEFEKLKAGSTIYDFTSLTAGQIIIVA
jgi:hypothetical protein